MKALEKVLKTKLKDKIQDQDINRLRSQYVASKIYERESLEAFSFSLGHGFAQNGDIHCEEAFINKIKEATTPEVNSGLQQVFSKDLHITCKLLAVNQ